MNSPSAQVSGSVQVKMEGLTMSSIIKRWKTHLSKERVDPVFVHPVIVVLSAVALMGLLFSTLSFIFMFTTWNFTHGWDLLRLVIVSLIIHIIGFVVWPRYKE